MDNSGREYRYQKDISVNGTMFHVRCDDWEEFVAACNNIEVLVEELKPTTTTSTGAMVAASVTSPATMTCKECGNFVGEEHVIEWKGSNFWVRDCLNNRRHKSGFWRKAQ